MQTRALAYCRVSTSEQANEGISLENQIAKIKAYCELNCIELVKIIEDAGKSGKNLNRDGIQEILNYVKENKINAILVYKLDRLSRKVIDTLSLIEFFQQNNISFHSLNEKIDTKTAVGKFFLNIIASLAQMERDLISERTKDALQFKIANNERAGQIPFGWKLAEDGKTLYENQQEQKIIRMVKQFKSKGYSLREICRKLTELNHQPIGQKWHPQTIKNILDRGQTVNHRAVIYS